MEGRNK